MTVIARDAVAADHLVYAWPFPLGPECEVSCNDDEQVVMCPAWMVGDRLGPGRHRWRTPDPTRPVAAFFVLTSPVEVSFDLVTTFVIPMNGMPVRLRAMGSLQVRCADPGLLIAQFVGLPFDSVNEGILRSVSRSVERMLARLLTRRVVMAGTPYAVTDPSMLGQIVEELIAYNPTAGAVFGVELIRMGYLAITADDGQSPYLPVPAAPASPPLPYGNHLGELGSEADIPMLDPEHVRALSQGDGHAEGTPPPDTAVASGEIVPRPPKNKNTQPGMPAPPQIAALGTNPAARGKAAAAAGADAPRSPEDPTAPGMQSPISGAIGVPLPRPGTPRPGTPRPEDRSAILGIGTGGIGTGGIGTGAIGGRDGEVSGEIHKKIAPGQRVLVPGPNGLMQSATVRQLLQGYYELEVGSSGETIWVPMAGVVPE